MDPFEDNPDYNTLIREALETLLEKAEIFLSRNHFERSVYLSFVAYCLFSNQPVSHFLRVDHLYMLVLLLVSNEALGKRLSKLYQIDLETSFVILNVLILLLLHPLGMMLVRKFVDYFFLMELDKWFIYYSKDRQRQRAQAAQQARRAAILGHNATTRSIPMRRRRVQV